MKWLAIPFCIASLVAFSSLPAAADVVDNFDSGTTALGIVNKPNGGWSSKWSAGTDQQDLLTNTAGVGVGGSNAVSLDVNVAQSNYNALNQSGITLAPAAGNSIVLSSSFQFTHDGESLPTQNNAFIGLQISTQNEWWDNSGTKFDFTVMRRQPAGQRLGVNLPFGGGITGWNSVGNFGLPSDGTAGTSGWFDMTVELTDNGSTYDATFTLFDASGNVATQQSGVATGIASGTTLYGGITTGFNGTGLPVNEFNGVTEVLVDDFSFTSVAAVPEPTALSLIGFVGMVGFLRRRR